MSWCQEIHTPKWQDSEGLDVLLDLELRNTEIVSVFSDDVPSDSIEIVDHISSASRHTATLVGPGSGIHGENVEFVVRILHLRLLSSGVDSGVTSLTEAQQIRDLEGKRCPRTNLRVDIDSGHDCIGA